jgi:nitroimidazol reductase NimA-like FMN-containing flavoprotein (pyridoxamine 5'-phosphate oxidase superfamily)
MTSKPELKDLTLDECWEHLARHEVGRVAVSIPGHAPLVVPVNYALDGRVIVFRTAPGTKLDGLRTGPISFQLDHIDPTSHAGWSVLVTGVAYEATSYEVSDVHLEPWAEGNRNIWVRILPRSVSGRRIELPEYIPLTERYL